MGKFIVVEVDRDDVADALVQRFADKSGMRVVGFFNRPRAHCPHTIRAGYHAAKEFARGRKYGWWLHNVPGCGRPRRGTHQLENLIGVDAYPIVEGREYTQRVAALSVFDVPTANMARRREAS